MPRKPLPATSRIELLQGTLDLIVLETLRWGPAHGYGIAQMIRANSRNVLQVDAGSLYPEKSNSVAGTSEDDPQRGHSRRKISAHAA